MYPAKNEEIYGIVPYQNFSCHVTLATLKKNFNMWVTSGSYVGHIRIVLWVSGSNGSTGVTHFQPWLPFMRIDNAGVVAGWFTAERAVVVFLMQS